MEEKYKKIITLFKENRGKNLTIERKYLPEIIYDDGWQINTNDGSPELKPLVEKTIKYWGVALSYDKDLILIFILKNFSLK